MKKLFTLVFASFVAIGVSARQPQVILNSPNEYDVKIDGQFYNGGSAVIPSLSQGLHTVEVYSVKGGFLGIGRKRELVSSTQFNLRNNDVRIDVDQSGQVRINELRSTDDRRIRTQDDRVYDGTVKNHGTTQGKGKKLGHYKDKHKDKTKKEKVYAGDDDDIDDNDDDKSGKGNKSNGKGKSQGKGRKS